MLSLHQHVRPPHPGPPPPSRSPYGCPASHMDVLPERGSQGCVARWAAGSADQRPEPASAGPPVTMRLGFRPLAAQLVGCRRARSASSLLSLEANRGVRDRPDGPRGGWERRGTAPSHRGTPGYCWADSAPGGQKSQLGLGKGPRGLPREGVPRSQDHPQPGRVTRPCLGAPRPPPEQLLLVPVQPRPKQPLLPVPGPLISTVLVGSAVPWVGGTGRK